MTAAPTRDDAMTLIGHAEYLRKCYGEEDMPRFFDALAQKILSRARETDGAVREALGWLSLIGPSCELFHHKKADQHKGGTPCPIEARYRAWLSALSSPPRDETKDDALHATPESERACVVCDADVCEHVAARLAPPADAATEAVGRDWTLCPQCGVRHAWADPDDPCAPLSTPAHAPSAKETRT